MIPSTYTIYLVFIDTSRQSQYCTERQIQPTISIPHCNKSHQHPHSVLSPNMNPTTTMSPQSTATDSKPLLPIDVRSQLALKLRDKVQEIANKAVSELPIGNYAFPDLIKVIHRAVESQDLIGMTAHLLAEQGNSTHDRITAVGWTLILPHTSIDSEGHWICYGSYVIGFKCQECYWRRTCRFNVKLGNRLLLCALRQIPRILQSTQDPSEQQ